MKYDRIIIGYHGCDADVAAGLLDGTHPFVPSENDYDWLGRGVYFWEYGHDRAWRWAREAAKAGRIDRPAVVGALIQLGRCFDLLDTIFTQELGENFDDFVSAVSHQGDELPQNSGQPPDYGLRRLDCAMVNWYLDQAEHSPGAATFQTVRGSFPEGGPAFPGSMISQQAHIQIAIRDISCILGVFRPL